MEPTLGRHVVDKQAIALNSFDQDCHKIKVFANLIKMKLLHWRTRDFAFSE